MLNPNLEMLPSSSEILKKKKKQTLVKHKRKNWSKTDIQEVERGIDDLRHQQLTGGVRAEKKDEELFYINKTSLNLNEEISSAKKTKLSLQEKLNSLYCYRNLKPDKNSAPAHIIRDNRSPQKESKRQLKIKRLETKKFKSRLEAKQKANLIKTDKENLISTDLDVSVLSKLNAKKEKDARLQGCNEQIIKAEFEKDLWTSSDLPEINHTNEYYFRSAKKLPIKKPKNPLYKKSALPSIELPHPGTSYNPDYDDHQELLLQAHVIELKKLQDEQRLMRKLALHAKKMSWAEMEKIWLDEMSVKDLFEVGNEESEQENQTELKISNEMSISKRELRRRLEKEKYGRAKANEPKAKRLKKKLQEKIKLRQKENEKKIRIQQNEIYRIKALKKEVDQKLEKEKEAALKRVQDEKHREIYTAKRLGSLKFEENELDLKLSSEITGNLRSLKAEGNILRERYKNLQKRNLIEPRERAKSYHKFWKKKFEKRNALEKTNFVFENNQKKNKK